MTGNSVLARNAWVRREAEDYTGIARALAFAGEATIATGRPADAADFFLRAGRGVTHRNDKADAARDQLSRLSE